MIRNYMILRLRLVVFNDIHGGYDVDKSFSRKCAKTQVTFISLDGLIGFLKE